MIFLCLCPLNVVLVLEVLADKLLPLLSQGVAIFQIATPWLSKMKLKQAGGMSLPHIADQCLFSLSFNYLTLKKIEKGVTNSKFVKFLITLVFSNCASMVL